MTAPQVGDTVAASFRPQWEQKGGKPYTVVGEVWLCPQGRTDVLKVGSHVLAGALAVDVVESGADCGDCKDSGTDVFLGLPCATCERAE